MIIILIMLAYRRRAALAALVAAALMLATGFLTVRGRDWSLGTDTDYCGVYLPAWPHIAYCETAS